MYHSPLYNFYSFIASISVAWLDFISFDSVKTEGKITSNFLYEL